MISLLSRYQITITLSFYGHKNQSQTMTKFIQWIRNEATERKSKRVSVKSKRKRETEREREKTFIHMNVDGRCQQRTHIRYNGHSSSERYFTCLIAFALVSFRFPFIYLFFFLIVALIVRRVCIVSAVCAAILSICCSYAWRSNNKRWNDVNRVFGEHFEWYISCAMMIVSSWFKWYLHFHALAIHQHLLIVFHMMYKGHQLLFFSWLSSRQFLWRSCNINESLNFRCCWPLRCDFNRKKGVRIEFEANIWTNFAFYWPTIHTWNVFDII